METAPTMQRLGTASATALSVLRLILAVVFPFLSPTERIATIFLAAGSDGLDGLIARRWGGMTWWGGLLDGACDKLFAVTVLVTFVVEDRLAVGTLLLLLVRDIVVLTVVSCLLLRRRWEAMKHLDARWPGKVTTAALFLLFLVLALPEFPSGIQRGFLIVTVLFSFLAAVDYSRNFGPLCWKTLRET